MYPFEYHEFNEHVEKSNTYWQRWLSHKATREVTSDLLNFVEKSGNRWLWMNGYEQVKSVSKIRIIFEYSFACMGAFLILRGFLVVISPKISLQIALGDLFIGSSSSGIQNMLITQVLILACGLRYLSFIAEKRGPIESFRIYHHLRTTNFDRKHFMLTPADCSYIQKWFYCLSNFYLIAPPFTCLGFAAWLFLTFTVNTVIYENFFSLFITGVWMIIIIITLTLGTYPSYWIYIQNTLIMVYTAFALNSNQFFGQLLVKSGSQVNQQSILVYFSQQNKIYNTIKRATVDLGQTFFYGVTVASGLADFVMFVCIFIGTGNNLFDYVIFTIGLTIFSAIVGVNILATLTVVKVSLCHSVNYQIARRCKLNLSTSLKLLATFERMNVNKIGFTLGGIFTMDAHTFLLYLLENAGLMLMFITNLNKSK